MHFSRRLVLLTFCLVCCGANAEEAVKKNAPDLLEEVPSPPKISDGEPMEEPQVTIRKKGDDTIEEYRIHGELYMMKVTPKIGKPYYLHKQDQDGGWINIGPNPPLSVPKWILFRF